MTCDATIPTVFAMISYRSAPLSGMYCCIPSIAIPNKIVATPTITYTLVLLAVLLLAERKYALNTSQANTPKITI